MRQSDPTKESGSTQVIKVYVRDGASGMEQAEFDARVEAGEDPLALEFESMKRQGYVLIPAVTPRKTAYMASPREQELMRLLDEAVEWARRPSPIPMEPFNDFLDRAGKFGAGPRGSLRVREALNGPTEAS